MNNKELLSNGLLSNSARQGVTQWIQALSYVTRLLCVWNGQVTKVTHDTNQENELLRNMIEVASIYICVKTCDAVIFQIYYYH